jgi:hypothetical protein
MSTVDESEQAIPGLYRTETKALRAGFDNFREDQLELTDGLKQEIDQSSVEIQAGNLTRSHVTHGIPAP